MLARAESKALYDLMMDLEKRKFGLADHAFRLVLFDPHVHMNRIWIAWERQYGRLRATAMRFKRICQLPPESGSPLHGTRCAKPRPSSSALSRVVSAARYHHP